MHVVDMYDIIKTYVLSNIYEREHELHRLLNALLSDKIKVQEKIEVIEKEYLKIRRRQQNRAAPSLLIFENSRLLGEICK